MQQAQDSLLHTCPSQVGSTGVAQNCGHAHQTLEDGKEIKQVISFATSLILSLLSSSSSSPSLEQEICSMFIKQRQQHARDDCCQGTKTQRCPPPTPPPPPPPPLWCQPMIVSCHSPSLSLTWKLTFLDLWTWRPWWPRGKMSTWTAGDSGIRPHFLPPSHTNLDHLRDNSQQPTVAQSYLWTTWGITPNSQLWPSPTCGPLEGSLPTANCGPVIPVDHLRDHSQQPTVAQSYLWTTWGITPNSQLWPSPTCGPLEG